MRVQRFIPEHLQGIELHKFMSEVEGLLTKEYGKMLASWPSYTYVADDKVIGCAGVIPYNDNAYTAWALITKDSGPYMFGFTKEVIKFLDSFDAKRIQSVVRSDFKSGIRWMNMLGFKCETPEPMKNYDKAGDYYLFARTN